VFADVDVEMLTRQRHKGTVKNWEDRRRDLYSVRYTADGEAAEEI
jgi:hypothetical protein